MAEVCPDDSSETIEYNEGQGHPLFPRGEHETGPDKRRIDLIQVDRTRDDGTLEHCPRYFKASEIRSWQDIVERFGGGAYRLRALCGKTYQFQGSTDRREFFGPPARPMADDTRSGQKQPARAEAAAAPATAQPPGAQPMAPGWPSPNGWPWVAPQNGISPEILALLMKSMERPATGPQDTIMAIVLKGMMDQQTTVMKAAFERPTAPNPLESLQHIKPLLENTSGVAQFIKGVELAKSLQATAPAADQGEDMLTMITQMIQKLAPVASTAPPALAAAPPPPPPPPVMAALPDRNLIRTIVRDPQLRGLFLEEMRQEVERTPRAPSASPVTPTSTASDGPKAPPDKPSQPKAEAGELAGPGTTPAAARENGGATETGASPTPAQTTGGVFGLRSLPFFNEPEFQSGLGDSQQKAMLDAIDADQQRSAA